MTINMGNSALKKGETLIDTAMTLNAMHPDIIIIRHQDSGAPNLLSQKLIVQSSTQVMEENTQHKLYWML